MCNVASVVGSSFGRFFYVNLSWLSVVQLLLEVLWSISICVRGLSLCPCSSVVGLSVIPLGTMLSVARAGRHAATFFLGIRMPTLLGVIIALSFVHLWLM